MFDLFKNLFLPNASPDTTQTIITILLTIGLGVLLGRIKLKKVSLGVSAVMFVGLFMGHVGYRIDEHISHFIREFGLILFVYGIGIMVGPSFFLSLKSEGIRLNFLAVCTVVLGESYL